MEISEDKVCTTHDALDAFDSAVDKTLDLVVSLMFFMTDMVCA